MINAKQQSEAREERAKSILQKGSPEALDEFTYLVPSQFDSTKFGEETKYFKIDDASVLKYMFDEVCPYCKSPASDR
ncbi:hypothetical protein HYU14_03755 [Candidatus Woesearchaeota archaeon]|nr:hypothetical protein [Candidatus Woesearchaeota archaeon]